MKNWLEPLATAWVGVMAHKLRSFLTMLGIVIGVGAVITLMSIGKGAEMRIISSIQGLGTNLLFISPGSTTEAGVRTAAGSAATLTAEDAEAIAETIDNVAFVAPTSGSNSQVVVGSENMRARTTGITPDYQQILNLQVVDGEPISDYHYSSAAKVILIGSNVNETLFKGTDAVGQTVKMGSTVMHVIGVWKSKGSVMGFSDDTILMPLTTMFQMASRSMTTSGQRVVSQIMVQLTDQKHMKSVTDDISSLLRFRHRLTTTTGNDFTITSQEDMIKAVSEAAGSMTFLLASIAAISLLVGGIGVMNIMLVSIMERTREIGLRKALGAEEKEIVIQFLIEAAFLSITGGVIGIVLGWGASMLVSRFGSYTTAVSADIVILAFSISAAIGLIFGLYPAWRGSRLDPIEALRYE
jgi:putative ABC transport system permease protein